MDKCQKLSELNKINQQSLNDIKNTILVLDKEEDLIINQIRFEYQELENLKKEYSNIFDIYNNIIVSLVKK